MTEPVGRRVPPSRRGRPFVVILGVLLFAFAGAVAGLIIVTRVETGEWRAPEVEDLSRVIKLAPGRTARIIVLERRPILVYAGANDAAHNVSSVLENVRSELAARERARQRTLASGDKSTPRRPITVPTGPAKLPGWTGSDRGWQQVMMCVTKLFAPFDVKIVDQLPTTHEDYILVPVGGKPSDIGVKDRRVAGLAPFNGGVIENPIVFAFSGQLGNDARQVCEAIGMEVAHAYGLDHGYLCNDVMTYLPPCGAKRFVDKDIRCGETKPRNCEGGEPTQNSYKRLLQVLGPRKLEPPLAQP